MEKKRVSFSYMMKTSPSGLSEFVRKLEGTEQLEGKWLRKCNRNVRLPEV